MWVDISQWSTETARLRSSISANRAFKDWRAGCTAVLSFLSEKRPGKIKAFFHGNEITWKWLKAQSGETGQARKGFHQQDGAGTKAGLRPPLPTLVWADWQLNRTRVH
jgi:hypothetical protein